MEWIDFAGWPLQALATEWRAARPFPHVVVDGVLGDAKLRTLRAAMAKEPHRPNRGEIFDFLGSSDDVEQPALRAFAAELGAARALGAVGAITGKTVARVELRSYVYLPGSYLLPHADWRAGAGRQVAYAYYLTPDGFCDGGELELFDCTVADGRVTRAAAALTVAHRLDRLVLFEVGIGTLHQVREVLRGARLSLAGWFF